MLVVESKEAFLVFKFFTVKAVWMTHVSCYVFYQKAKFGELDYHLKLLLQQRRFKLLLRDNLPPRLEVHIVSSFVYLHY